MKRRIAAHLVIALLAGSSACSRDAAPKAGPEQPADDWVRPPAIRSVERGPASLIFHGLAQPGARVVLRARDGQAYAAAADESGRFDIRMAPPAGHRLLRPEAQQGQDAIPSPGMLLIVDGGRGPIALLRSGGAARRLDRGPALGAIDSDGRGMIASGVAAANAPPAVRVPGGPPVRVATGPDGRWTAILGPVPSGPQTIQVGGAAFVWPGAAANGEALAVERAGEGWRVGWTGPAGGRQTTWLPDAGS
jgi:hypothetical protein